MKAAVAWLALAACVCAQEKKDAPKIIAVSPLDVAPGAEVTLRFRGLKLDTATEVRFPAALDVKPAIAEKKAATIPNGLEAKDAGDKELVVKATLPVTLAGDRLAIEVVTPEGVLKCGLPVLAAASVAEEKEPNNGFATAQPIEAGRRMRGRIGEDKDVDVFKFPAKAGGSFKVEVVAARDGSALDAMLTIYDGRRRVVGRSDDAVASDPALEFEAKADGEHFLVVQDAHDRGGAWHGYAITITAKK